MVKKRITVYLDETVWKKFQGVIYRNTKSFRETSSQLEKLIKEWIDKNK